MLKYAFIVALTLMTTSCRFDPYDGFRIDKPSKHESMPNGTQDLSDCGRVVISCNCNYIQRNPGDEVNNYNCSSGKMTIQTCDFLCGPRNIAWGATCSCR